MLELGQNPRILITRLSAIGDCIHCAPLATALKRRYPNAFITWATQGGPAKLLEGHRHVDLFLPINRSWMKSLRSIATTRKVLRDLEFDVCIDPQSLTKSSALGWLSGARQRVGFARGQGRELSPILNNHLIAPQTTHVVDRYLELLEPLDVPTQPVDFLIPENQQASRTMGEFLNSNGVRDYALLNPGAGWDSKLWPHERYAEVAEFLHRHCGLATIALWSGNRERRWATDITERSPALLAPTTSLPELSELCHRARLFIGSDTGPLHLAAAVGTKCVAMFGPTRKEVCGPYGPGHIALQAYLQEGNSKQRRGHDNSAMQAISSQMVCDAATQLLHRAAA